jgi:hypothetical protein
MVLLIASDAFFVAAVLLLLHHGWKHAHEDPETSHAQEESCPEVCYFQRRMLAIAGHATTRCGSSSFYLFPVTVCCRIGMSYERRMASRLDLNQMIQAPQDTKIDPTIIRIMIVSSREL